MCADRPAATFGAISTPDDSSHDATPPTRDRRHRRVLAAGVLVAALGLVLTSCSSGPSPSASSTPVRPGRSPAGPVPWRSPRWSATPKAQSEIAQTLGVTAPGVGADVGRPRLLVHLPTTPTAPSSFTVKELSSWTQTLASFHHSPRLQQGRAQEIRNLGQGAFQTTAGNVVVRKDWKILHVDVIRACRASSGTRPPPSW